MCVKFNFQPKNYPVDNSSAVLPLELRLSKSMKKGMTDSNTVFVMFFSDFTILVFDIITTYNLLHIDMKQIL